MTQYIYDLSSIDLETSDYLIDMVAKVRDKHGMTVDAVDADNTCGTHSCSIRNSINNI